MQQPNRRLIERGADNFYNSAKSLYEVKFLPLQSVCSGRLRKITPRAAVDLAERTRYNVDMEKVTVLANAKLNLYLDVAGTRADGYHDLDMLMVTVNCGDVITVRKAESGFLSVKMDGAEAGEENTAYRTARLVCDLTGSGLDITIAKKIPIGAGMGGSSADSAGVLNAAKKLLGISDSAANEIALQVGSDVVYMMRGGIMRARGRGEILTPVEGLESLRSKFFVVAQKCMGAPPQKYFPTSTLWVCSLKIRLIKPFLH